MLRTTMLARAMPSGGARPSVAVASWSAAMQQVRGAQSKAFRRRVAERKALAADKTDGLYVGEPDNGKFHAIYGSFSPITRHLMRSLGSTDPRAQEPAGEAVAETRGFVPGYGYAETEINTLFSGLEQAAMERLRGAEYTLETVLKQEEAKRQIVMDVLGMKNASYMTWKKQQTQWVVRALGQHEHDTGTAEVQAGVWMMRVVALAEHLKYNNKDKRSLTRLSILVRKRNAVLRYLRDHSTSRYVDCLRKLGLSDRLVLAEVPATAQLLV
ncbi:mitochondrial 37S ribosomal protein uS15m [Dipodascopsis tothii]|uniref:mitochondrial 37S ribosomal protein uS15m n=1 Tax=Dipodascopsis tothii TaxID=44089 RepID=UPI0034CFA700